MRKHACLVFRIARMKIRQNFQAAKYDIKQHSDDRTRVNHFKAIEKYPYGLGKTVSKHLKISEFSLVKISKILFLLKLILGRFPFVRTDRPDHRWSRLFWQWNRLFPRVFAEKPSLSCVVFRIWLIWLDSFDQKWNSRYYEKGLAGQFWKKESAPSSLPVLKLRTLPICVPYMKQ